jgi:two-component system, cell cycle sensor histidine kinase and response regulator CckA
MNNKQKVLVVDDEDSILFTFQHILSKNGYDVSVAKDLEAAKEMIDNGDYDVACIDRILSKGQNGIELIKYINNVQPLCQTILASAYPSFESAAEILQCDCVAYLTKPVKKDELLASIREALSRGLEKRNLELRESLFSSLYDRFPMSIVVYDLSGKVLSIKPNFSEMFGYGLDDLSMDPFIYISQTDRNNVEQDISNLIKNGHHEEREIKCVTNDRRTIEISVKLSLCKDKNGSEMQMLVMLHDISEKKNFEKQLFLTQKMESIAALAGGIAHDVNNMLSVILGNIQLLQLDDNLNEGYQNVIKQITTATQKSTKLLNQILSLGKKEEGSFSISNVDSIVLETSALLRILLPKSIRIETKLSDEIKLAHINQSQIEQCIFNLGLNARDAINEKENIEEGALNNFELDNNKNEISISTGTVSIDGSNGHLFPGVNQGKYIAIYFTDTGLGIRDQIKSKVFDPFFSTKPHGEGTGLGLYTTHKTIMNHLGFINVESQRGQGTTFSIFLPAADEQLGAPLDASYQRDDSSDGNLRETRLD